MKIERMCQSRWMHYAGGLEEPDNQTTEDEPLFSPQQAPVICILTIFIRHLCTVKVESESMSRHITYICVHFGESESMPPSNAF